MFVDCGIFNPLHHNISVFILHTVLYTFPKDRIYKDFLTVNGLETSAKF